MPCCPGSGLGRRLLAEQFVLQKVELGANAAVEDQVADVGDNAPDQCRVNFGLNEYLLLAGDSEEVLLEGRERLLIERHCRADTRSDATNALVIVVLEGYEDVSESGEAVVVEEQRNKIRGDFVCVAPAEDRLEHC